MASFLNVCRFNATSSGTGDFVVSTAVTGFQTPAGAGAVNGAIYRYRAESADLSQWEIGYGAYTSGSTTLARSTILSNSSGGTSAINFSSAPRVAVVALAEDLVFINPPQGRLTLQTATPVMPATQSAKTTIYYTPYVGNQIPIYDGVSFRNVAFSELSVATTDNTKSPAAIGASKVNDWFVWDDAGTTRIGHGPDWTSDTARSAGTALTMVNGILLNSAALTNGPAASRGTYVGTTRSDGSSQLNWVIGAAASGGTAGNLALWNTYNRVVIGSTSQDTASSLYTSNTIRQYGGATAMQCSYILGLSEDSILASISSEFALAAASGAFAIVGIGLDSTTTFQFSRYRSPPNPAASTYVSPWTQSIVLSQPAIGYHTLSLNQQGDGTNSCEYNNSLKGIIAVQLRM